MTGMGMGIALRTQDAAADIGATDGPKGEPHDGGDFIGNRSKAHTDV
jgi:hypothetical protein